MRILITRPLEDGTIIAGLLAEHGHQTLLAPLLAPRFHEGPEPDLKGVTALLATSANGIRAFVRRTSRRDFSVFAVGPQTTEQARNAGFTDVRNADGDAKTLATAAAKWASKEDILLHICGEDAPETLAESLKMRGFQVRRCPLYSIEPASQLPLDVRAALHKRELDAVMFFSPKSARLFRTLAQDLPTSSLTAFCISPSTAQALHPMPFARIAVAARPNQTAIVELVDQNLAV